MLYTLQARAQDKEASEESNTIVLYGTRSLVLIGITTPDKRTSQDSQRGLIDQK